LYALVFGVAAVGGGALLHHLVSGHVFGEIDEDISRRMGEFIHQLQEEGLSPLRTEIASFVAAGGKNDFFVRLLDAQGDTLISSDMSDWRSLVEEQPRGASLARPRFETLHPRDQKRLARLLSVPAGEGRTLQIGASLEDSLAFLDHLEHYGVIILVTMLSLGSLFGWFLARRVMRGVEEVTRAAAGIADGNFADRVSAPPYGREIDQLVGTFNRMAQRLETLMAEMRQVNDSIAHDLRSPITRIRGLAEAAVMDRTLCGEGAELAGSIVEECDRLMGLINTLLDIAEAEAGVHQLVLQRIDLAELASQAVELFSGVAEDQGIRLASHALDSPQVQGDRRRLQRALANLVDNAIKYTPPGGSVTLETRERDQSAEIAVADTGPGIGAEDLPFLFDRFYRGDRARQLPGNGLGLSLALAVVHAHGGDIQVASGPQGSTFTLRLPAAVAEDQARGPGVP